MSIFKGSGVAIVTPFNENGVNFDKLKELLDWHVKCGTDAIIVCATTGEAPTMTENEKKTAIKFTVDTINKRIPVIASTGSNCTKNAIDMSKWAESIGVDAVLSITPYYNKTTQRGIYEHFKAISKSINVPIIIYNVPSRTGLNVAPKTLYELMEFDNIRGIKEASGDISQIATMKSLCRDRLELYSGNDDQIIPILSLGGLGVISTIANIMPKEIHEMCMNYLKGDTKKALDMQLDTLDLMHALFMETNPIPIKTAMNLLKMNVGDVRLPLCEMSPSNLNILKDKLHKQKLL